MDSMQSFLNMKVDMKEFGDIYNKYTTNKLNFGGGSMTVKDLLLKARFADNQTVMKRAKKGGAEVPLGIESSSARENFFYLIRPNQNFTDINSMSDMVKPSSSYPSYPQVMERSIT